MTSNRASRSRKPRPLPDGDSLFTPGASPARRALESLSATPLLWLHQLPAWLLPVLLAALLVTGLTVRGLAAAAALSGVALVLGGLAALSWPKIDGRGRLLRGAAIAAVVVIAVIQASR